MSKHSLSLVSAIAAAFTLNLSVFPSTGPATHKDQEAMQGKWRVTSLTAGGVERPKESFKELQLEIKADKYLITDDGKIFSRTIKLYPKRMPKAIDITYDDGENKGKTNRAIYTIEGDVLKICRRQQPELERPTEFTSPLDTDVVIITWKRDK